MELKEIVFRKISLDMLCLFGELSPDSWFFNFGFLLVKFTYSALNILFIYLLRNTANNLEQLDLAVSVLIPDVQYFEDSQEHVE